MNLWAYLLETFGIHNVSCIAFLLDVCDVFHRAMLYNDEQLILHCLQYMMVNTESVLKSNGFLRCEKLWIAS